MKLITSINQNIPIWAVIKGDHACGEISRFLNTDLITKPDFLSKRENALRMEFLKNTKGRKWLYQYLHCASFGLYKITEEDLSTVLSVWKNIPLVEIAKEYQKAYDKKQGWEYKKCKKPWQAVEDVCKRKKEIKPVTPIMCLEDYDLDIDYHRSIWMKRSSDQNWQIIDGTHRMIATYWKYILSNKALPELYCIGFEE